MSIIRDFQAMTFLSQYSSSIFIITEAHCRSFFSEVRLAKPGSKIDDVEPTEQSMTLDDQTRRECTLINEDCGKAGS